MKSTNRNTQLMLTAGEEDITNVSGNQISIYN